MIFCILFLGFVSGSALLYKDLLLLSSQLLSDSPPLLPGTTFELGSMRQRANTPVPEFIDPVFAKTSQKRSFSVIENERLGLVSAKTGSLNSGTGAVTEVCFYSGSKYCRDEYTAWL